MKKPLPILFLCLALALSALSGCNNGSEPSPAESAPVETPIVTVSIPEATPQLTPDPYNEDGTFKVPFVETKQISVWDVLDESDDPAASSLNSAIGGLLNIDLSYSFASPATAKEQFDMMSASGDYADMMLNVDEYYEGGADKAIDDGVIISLDGIAGDVPNVSELLVDHSEYFKLSEGGRLFQLPVVVETVFEQDAKGLATRADGLEYLEITSPETYDEFYFLLVMLKNICGGKRGYLLPDDGYSQGLAYGYGAYNGFYQIDDQVKFGFLETSFKEYMDFVYVLLDKRLAIFEQADSGYSLAGRVDSTWVSCWYGGMDEWNAVADKLGEGKIAGITYPVPASGDSVHLLDVESVDVKGMSVSVLASETKFDVITALCNYFYSDEFTTLANYGAEGDSMTFVDGQPVLTDAILTASDPAAELKKHALVMNIPHIVDESALAVSYNDSQLSAMTMWTAGTDGSYLLPELEFTAEEQTKIDSVMADINARINEFVPGYEKGDYDAYDYEDVRNEILDMGIQDVLSIYQKAYNGGENVYESHFESLNDKVSSGRSSYSYSAPAPAPAEETPAETAEPAPEEVPGEAAEPVPGETVPADGEPVDTAPVDTAPVDTAPVDTAPVDTAPVDTAPVDTSPVDTAPAQPSADPIIDIVIG